MNNRDLSPPGPAREAYHHGDLATALLDGALALLAQGHEPSLRAVARQAGVSTMAPYRHYADKDALLAAIAVRGLTQLHDAVLAADRAAAPGRALVAQALAYVRYAHDNPVLFRLMFGPTRPRADEAVCDAAQAVKTLMLQRLVSEAPEQFSPDRAIGCWSLVHGLAMLVLDGLLDDTDPNPLDGLVERVVQTMLEGRQG
ncbi:TetR/AcrR family transcriptional regulator [Caulobacter hibisci]|uniref:TetR/AcrR family transcriptional regulator n=1 Tax=Caulobacter hibisci TaxID=2035993 RepID=A0ABS0SXG0_9CAUL|nr:TetR/AcrR family transcriptional regulator [Caulobacter hibisci]MBI1684104.1 TetR/AcrR family transcriptional regulator [Caulobacter hibisci]